MHLHALHAQQINAGKIIDPITQHGKAIPNIKNIQSWSNLSQSYACKTSNENIRKLKLEQYNAAAETQKDKIVNTEYLVQTLLLQQM